MIGNTIGGRYKVIEKLGAGGMGDVFLAEQESLGRKVAIKTIRAALLTDEEILARFTREAKVIAQLNHQNVVTVYDFGALDDGGFYIAMEYLRGDELADIIQKGRLPWQDTVEVVRQIAMALRAAHAAGIVHRDLKPDNIMLTADTESTFKVKVLDFGIAKIDDENLEGRQLTGTGMILGTPGYMAPEVIRGDSSTTAATDMYSLGLIWLEMLLGKKIYRRQAITAMLVAQATEEPPSISTEAPQYDIPMAIDALLVGLTRKDPAERLSNAGELVQQLERLAPEYNVSSTIQKLVPLPLVEPHEMNTMASRPGEIAGPEAWTLSPVGGTSGTGDNEPATQITTHPPQANDPSGVAVVDVGVTQPSREVRPNRTPLIAAAVLSLCALGVAAYLVSSSSDKPAAEPAREILAKAPTPKKQPVVTASAPVDAVQPESGNTVVAQAEGFEFSGNETDTKPKARRRNKKRKSASSQPSALNTKPSKNAPPLSSELLLKGIRARMGTASSCRNTVITQHPSDRAGLLVDHCPSYDNIDPDQRISLTVEESGVVSKARFVSAQANQSDIGQCILASIRKWRLPSFKNSGEAAKLRPKVKFRPCLPINGKCVFSPPK